MVHDLTCDSVSYMAYNKIIQILYKTKAFLRADFRSVMEFYIRGNLNLKKFFLAKVSK